jgi:hypothetical protein
VERKADLFVGWEVEQKVGLDHGFGLGMEECNVFVFEAGEKAKWQMSWRREDNQVYRTSTAPVDFNQILAEMLNV